GFVHISPLFSSDAGHRTPQNRLVGPKPVCFSDPKLLAAAKGTNAVVSEIRRLKLLEGIPDML
ncbi:MAG TPA: hypothetical protein PK971_07695, partial [Saprospiraceae bacterium]|nr:hypothetical protein [Saprospiraceae bacterium]